MAINDSTFESRRIPRPQIKTICTNGEYWFVAQDVWEALGVSRQAFRKVPEEFKGRIKGPSGYMVAAVNLQGLLCMLTILLTQHSILSNLNPLLVDVSKDREPLVTGKSLSSSDRMTLTGVSDCLAAVMQVARETRQQKEIKSAANLTRQQA